MKPWLARGAALLLAIVAVCGALAYLRMLRAELVDAHAARQAAEATLAARDRELATRRALDAAAQRRLAALEQTRDAARTALTARDSAYRRLEHDNAKLREWASAALPDDVVRLHEHPAFTGAGPYLEFMRAGDPLHAAGDLTTRQR
jgi:LysB family phage lysis regulatory protein